MREIKFRAWDKSERVLRDVEELHKTWIAVAVQVADDEVELQQRRREDVELLQFTGLKDKNGKEIYEGDIVEFNPISSSSTDTCVIEQRGWYYEPFQRCFGMVKVIGNIYENPELLK